MDGTGAPRRRADVGVVDGRVVAVDERITESARERIDADGLVVAPGFVDSHAHVDGQVFWDPLATPSSWNGYTSLVVGNCGFSLACAGDDADYGISVMAGVEQIPRSLLASEVPFIWADFAGYVAAVESSGLAVNIASFAGYPMARHQVMGERAFDEAATDDELQAIDRVLRGALDAGALGLSLNRYGGDRDDEGRHVAGWDAPWGEIGRAVAVAGDYPGTVLQALPRWFMSGAGVPDAAADDAELGHWIDVLRRARRRLVWGPMVDGRSEELLGYGARAAAAGVELVAGTHPLPVAGMTSFALPNNIFAFVPAWHFLFALSPAEQVVALQDPVVRARMRTAATDEFVTVYRGTVFDDRHDVVTLGDPLRFPWDGMVFVGAAPARFDVGGPSIGTEARATGRAPVDVLLDKVVETKAAGFFYTPLTPYSADRSIDIMSDPRTVLSGNDTGAHLQRLSQQGSTLLLGRYVRELGSLSLEHAVHQLTGRQADVFCLPDRGVLAPGMAADVVLFDEERVDAMAPEIRADLPGAERRVVTAALGIERVIVNGVSILAGGQPTGARPGRFLRPADMLDASAAR